MLWYDLHFLDRGIPVDTVCSKSDIEEVLLVPVELYVELLVVSSCLTSSFSSIKCL